MQPLRVSRSEIALHRGPVLVRDPAPSRLTYKAHRLWLTPMFRAMTQVGLPFVLITALVGWYFSVPENRAALAEQAAELRRSVETRPEFMLKLMSIDGASPVLADGIRKLYPVDFPISSFDVDLDEMHARIAGLDVVENVDIHVRPGGVLEVVVTERTPALVWRRDGGLDLIDAGGHRVASLTERAARSDLPLIAGEGAAEAAPEALKILAATEPLAGDLRGLVRVGARRWDIVLDGGPRILLPEADPLAALETVLALDRSGDLFARDVTHVDMRNPARPTLRLGTPAADVPDPIQSSSAE